MTPAPIILFTYNRLNHTQRIVEALLENKLSSESELFVFSDAAKNPDAEKSVAELRNYLYTITGFKKVHVIEREKNYGLANNIIDGVTKIVNTYDRVIVVEDDILVSPYFLQYMNDALEFYQGEPKVVCIHAYLYPLKESLRENFFLRGADCWGWGTWKRGWDVFEPNGEVLLDFILKNNLSREFDYDGSIGFTKMLRDQIKGKNNSWAIRWHASAFIQNKLTLYPNRSLAMNIGHDGSGVHSGVSDEFDVEMSPNPVPVKAIPLEVSEPGRRAFVRYFFSTKPSILTRARFKLKKMFS
jgi:hypothetical protein